jgi:TfoX/Sxy family transcriptional regulator of competence genes
MATKRSTIEYIEDQLTEIPLIHSRKMFGEYALYCGTKVVALVCDDKLFVKITEEGKMFVGEHYEEGRAYPGARPSMYIDEDMIDDHEWLCELIRITEQSLPLPKPKEKKNHKEGRGIKK